MTSTSTLDPALPMRDLLAAYPGAQRALFRKYHVGGCSSCGFAPTESLAQICARNPHMDLPEVAAFLQTSQEEDRAMQITPGELHAALQDGQPAPVHLLDIRTREEFDAVHLDGAQHFTQELMNAILMQWPRDTGLIALIDHQGARSLDAAAYFAGHGFTNVRALLGGIDAWSQQVDPGVTRYNPGIIMQDLEARILAAQQNPQNLGEMSDADSVGTVGSPDCGDMLRMWVKFKDQDGKKVIDRATFQTFGCQTAIAVASVATELIAGKTVDEALALSGEELAAPLGALPPMKIHCAQLVEGALRSALAPTASTLPVAGNTPPPDAAPTLYDSLTGGAPAPGRKLKVVLMDKPVADA